VNPNSAVISITNQCNSHCVMCDIWKNQSKPSFLTITDIQKLPKSLTDINITGGEPFLHPNLSEIIKSIKSVCPKSQIIINTNGFQSKIIANKSTKLFSIDPKIGLRVSLDGYGRLHSQLRNTKNAWAKATKTIGLLQQIGIKNLGVSFTIMKKNVQDISKIFEFCQENQLQLSLTLASDSPIYFGQNKIDLRPQDIDIKKIISSRLTSIRPKEWLRAYFDHELVKYNQTNHRSLPCYAGKNSFYLDHQANLYICHLHNWLIGNLRQSNFHSLWSKAKTYQKNVAKCQDCWMVCSFKPSIKYHFSQIIFSLIKLKLFYET
jgi:MoaA/NifB/PqqE/SkfB family radical SAM enzyme